MRATVVLLVRHATTASTRSALFPLTSGAAPAAGCEPLDRAGRDAAMALGHHVGTADRFWASHARRARETAAAWGVQAECEADLAECDFGRWAGLAPEEVHRTDAEGLAAWYADPGTAPHGGETLEAVRGRARRLLARAADLGGATVAVTHGGLIKAALLEVLGLPHTAVWKLDAAPTSVTELHVAGSGWRIVRLNWTPSLARSW